MGFFSDAKDRMLEAMALPVLNSKLAPYGQARELHLNSTEKTVEFLFDLKGEQEPVRVAIGRYEFVQDGGATCLIIHDIRTSREWMTAAAERSVAGRLVKLPPEFAGIFAKLV